jgi:hypothetical protein
LEQSDPSPWAAQDAAAAAAQAAQIASQAAAQQTSTDSGADAEEASEIASNDAQLALTDAQAQSWHDQALAMATGQQALALAQASSIGSQAAADAYFASVGATPLTGPGGDTPITLTGDFGNAHPIGAYLVGDTVDQIDGVISQMFVAPDGEPAIGPQGIGEYGWFTPGSAMPYGVLGSAVQDGLNMMQPGGAAAQWSGSPTSNTFGPQIFGQTGTGSQTQGGSGGNTQSGGNSAQSSGQNPFQLSNVGGTPLRTNTANRGGPLSADNLGITKVTGAIGNFFYNLFWSGKTTKAQRDAAAAAAQPGFMEQYVPKAQDINALPDLRHDFQKRNEDTTYKAQRQGIANAVTAVVPGVNDARDVYEVVTGKDFVTGEQLDTNERVATAIMTPLIGASGSEVRAAQGGLESVQEARRVAKGADATKDLNKLENASEVAKTTEDAVEGVTGATADTSVTRNVRGVPVTAQVTKDAAGRITSSSATITIDNLYGGTGTTAAARAMTSPDDAGHIIGKLLGGPGGATSDNIFAQLPGINRGQYAQFEQRIAAQVRAGKSVQVKVTLIYPDATSTRPVRIKYDATVDGNTTTRMFDNN